MGIWEVDAKLRIVVAAATSRILVFWLSIHGHEEASLARNRGRHGDGPLEGGTGQCRVPGDGSRRRVLRFNGKRADGLVALAALASLRHCLPCFGWQPYLSQQLYAVYDVMPCMIWI
jgi:hypothetical protein